MIGLFFPFPVVSPVHIPSIPPLLLVKSPFFSVFSHSFPWFPMVSQQPVPPWTGSRGWTKTSARNGIWWLRPSTSATSTGWRGDGRFLGPGKSVEKYRGALQNGDFTTKMEISSTTIFQKWKFHRFTWDFINQNGDFTLWHDFTRQH